MYVGEKYVPCDNCLPARKTAGQSGISTQGKQRLTQAGLKEGWARHGLNQLSLQLKCNFKQQVDTNINKQSP